MSNSVSESPLLVEHDGAIDWVTFNRPRSLNAINQEMHDALYEYFLGLTTNYEVRVVVLRGAGRAFCAGMDLVEGPFRSPPLNEATGPHPSLPNIVRLMRNCPQPIISLVHGAACGGGFIFALASDVRFAGESARMNAPFIKLGLSNCELGISFFLPRTVGLSVAAELMYTGDFIDAQRALQTGLVSRVVPDSELENAGRMLAKQMLEATPHGLRSTKLTLNQALKLNDLDAIIDLEERAQLICMKANGPRALWESFLPKSRPATA
jgi:enoyl-CoA hydratase/carnithine racemase